MKEITKSQLNKMTTEVILISHQAGEVLKKYYKKIDKLKITAKAAAGVVSIADKQSELFIIKKLKKLYPMIPFLAEETTYEEFSDSREYMNSFKKIDYCWVIDPLDGTSNFLNGLDYFAICISLLEKGRPVLGVVYNPITDDCFYAWRDGGAWLRKLNTIKKPVRLFGTENKKTLRQSLFVTGFITEKGELFNREFSMFKNFMSKTRGIRRMGSAALDLCFVAKGVFDGFWEYGLAPWDVAAAGFICQEAGVKVTDYRSIKFDPFQDSIVAARSPLHAKVCQELNS